MSVINLNTVNELLEKYYIPALKRERAEQRLYMERWYGMRNPMPFFNWWPWLGKAVAAPADVRSRLFRAWRELRTGER